MVFSFLWFRRLVSVALALLVLCTHPAHAAEAAQPIPLTPTAQVSELLLRAKSMGLGDSPGWLRLGHYRGSKGSYESEVDGEKEFFLAPHGKEDPSAELDATIRGVLAKGAMDDTHAACKFPARVLFLVEHAGLDGAALNNLHCAKFEEYMRSLAPTAVSVIFSSYYLNNPSSAFGHTFLKFRRRRYEGSPHQDLLDAGIDFAAIPDTANPVAYAVKGVFGLFPGRFSKYPYFYKVREYNDFESRDIWEYELNLSDEEVLRISAHIWELGQTYIAYYFLTENCSYHILGVIEAAVPRADLIRHTHNPVLPADTIKVLRASPGLVKRVAFRPSARTTFRARLVGLSGAEQSFVSVLADLPNAPFPSNVLQPARQVLVLDAAADLVDLRFGKDILPGQGESVGARLKQALLVRRANMRVMSPDFVVAPEEDSRPESAHPSRRVQLATGWDTLDGASMRIGYRFAAHDATDPQGGYAALSEIEFGHVRARALARDPWFRLDEATFVHVRSLAPIDRFEHKMSFDMRLGAERVRDLTCRDCVVGGLHVAGGTAFGGPRASAALLVGTEVIAGPKLNGMWEQPMRVGVGPMLNLRAEPVRGWILAVEGGPSYYPFLQAPWGWGARGSSKAKLSQHVAVGVEALASPTVVDVAAASSFYF